MSLSGEFEISINFSCLRVNFGDFDTLKLLKLHEIPSTKFLNFMPNNSKKSMKLYIKNMVCNRCEMAVQLELEKMQIPILSMQLGEVEISRNLREIEKRTLAKNLNELGFELLDDKISKTIERIKNLIIDLVHYQNEKLKINLSTYLAEDLKQDYSALSNLFFFF